MQKEGIGKKLETSVCNRYKNLETQNVHFSRVHKCFASRSVIDQTISKANPHTVSGVYITISNT